LILPMASQHRLVIGRKTSPFCLFPKGSSTSCLLRGDWRPKHQYQWFGIIQRMLYGLPVGEVLELLQPSDNFPKGLGGAAGEQCRCVIVMLTRALLFPADDNFNGGAKPLTTSQILTIIEAMGGRCSHGKLSELERKELQQQIFGEIPGTEISWPLLEKLFWSLPLFAFSGFHSLRKRDEKANRLKVGAALNHSGLMQWLLARALCALFSPQPLQLSPAIPPRPTRPQGKLSCSSGKPLPKASTLPAKG
jgi:hypothetical protein